MNFSLANESHLENSSEFLCGLTDTNFRLLHANNLFQKQFGLKHENWKGRLFEEVIQSFHLEKFLQANVECINNPGKTISIEIQTTTGKNNNWFRWEISAIVDENNHVAGIRFLGSDITKQKKASCNLVKEQKLFETFMEHAPALVWLNNEDGMLHYMNTLFKNTFNLPENIIGKNIYDNYPASIKGNCMAGDKEVLAKNKGIENYEERLDENGEKICYQVYKFPVGDHDRKHLIGGLAFNITSQINDKVQILKQRNQFQSFMENAPLLAWITDAEGVLHYMNTRFRNSYNYTEDHLNKKIGSIKSLTERERALLPHADVIIKQKSIELFHEWIDENKKVHSYRTFKFPIKDGEGNYLEGGQSVEITGEVFAQRALKRSNELFEYAGKATRDVIWDWNLKENKIRRTGGYKNLYGYEMTDLYESHNYDKIHKDDVENVLKIIEETFKRNDPRWQIEYKYLCADGNYKTVIDQAYIIRNKSGKAVRVIGSMQDVTEERHLQQQVLITEKQKKKDVVDAVIGAQEKERNELSAELHDNVNQLLAASILYLKTAQKQEVIQGNLISQSLDYVQKAVDELRNISRNLTPAELKMNGLIAALKVFAEKLHIPKSFEVKLVIGELSENRINQSLKLAVYRIVQEVINNILKHANASEVIIHIFETGDFLILTVMDNGKGFDLLTMQKGLGITNIYNRAEIFGGSAEIISSPRKGCTWQVKIPLN